jgi:hypothetical protein
MDRLHAGLFVSAVLERFAAKTDKTTLKQGPAARISVLPKEIALPMLKNKSHTIRTVRFVHHKVDWSRIVASVCALVIMLATLWLA